MTPHACPRCGRPLSADAPGGLCAGCLLAASAETLVSGSMDDLATMSSAAAPVIVRGAPRLSEGDRWGSYQIGRLLGRGGMGEVYDAEHVPSGRRVALKVLSSPLQSAEERARFLREGQLAASVSHPHTVYIFGSEEIDGVPVISMELLSGGTLKDRVVTHGPMRPAEAVAAVMDLIGGLDAAAGAGILHRDIKPSNCFIDHDGVVKVGDFGLSISTLARDVHQQLVTSGFEGTPHFAPPEQLRGEPLDVRADIYAVGATLYYLLTGRPPFDAPDLRELFAKVTKDAPVPPRQLRRDIPARLSAVVMRCLAKSPADRPSSYPALADALRPFLARQDRPAPLAMRTVAGMVDAWIIVGIPVGLITTLLADPLSASPERMAAVANLGWMATVVYYLVLEGATGASLGKRLFGLRVVSGAGSPPTWPHAAARAILFRAPDILVAAALGAPVFYSVSVSEASSSGFYINWKQTAPPLLMVVMFFATARPRNGWTGLHDVLSGTRVVARAAAIDRRGRVAQQAAGAVMAVGSSRRYGPFVAVEAGDPRPGTVVRAFDPVLRREVWIETADSSKPPVSGARRDLSRPARLHWLAGRRSPEESWDAYEAPDGAAWTTGVAEDAWPHVKLQLLDLSNELAHSTDDGTRPPLALDRVWLRDNGRVVLLDFPAPDSASRAPADLTPEQLLQAAVARVPSHQDPGALPLSARAFLERWSGHSRPTLDSARTALQAMAGDPDSVRWWRRALPSVLTGAPVVLMLLISLLLVPAFDQFANSDASRMLSLLGVLQSKTLAADNPMRRPDVREAAELAIAGRYASMIRDKGFWNSGVVKQLAPTYRPLAEDILARRPDVSAEELAKAEAVLAAARKEADALRPAPRLESDVEPVAVIASTVTAGALAIVLACLIVSSLVAPGGIVSRQLGLATVTRTGREIGRVRSLIRALVIGLPAIAWFVYLAQSPRVQGFVPTPGFPLTATLVTVGVLALGSIWTIARRTRGPHDLLTGTWVVPR